jgi:phosphoribosylformimino-5-aminoimidazole carboxamide ribotide isomerase
VATDGWAKVSGRTAAEMAQRFEEAGVEALVFTDIGRDGMMRGVNVEATRKLAREVEIPIIASGGVSSIDDVRGLCAGAADGIMGAIVGRALYEGTIDLKEAQSLAAELTAA